MDYNDASARSESSAIVIPPNKNRNETTAQPSWDSGMPWNKESPIGCAAV